MAKKKKRTVGELQRIWDAREAPIYQDNDMLQLGSFRLTVNEQRIIHYAMAYIKPTDTEFQEYTFRIKDFLEWCGASGKESYTEIKKMVDSLGDRSWWMDYHDEKYGKGETKVRWFNITRTYEKSGFVTVAFHPDMMKHLLQLLKQYKERNVPFTKLIPKYMLPLKSRYGQRLYQLLRSILGNDTRNEYWFQLDRLKRLLDCEGYERYADFRKRALEPAISEINKYTDINVSHEIRDKDGKRIMSLVFFIKIKTDAECLEAELQGQKALDGRIEIAGQYSLFTVKDDKGVDWVGKMPNSDPEIRQWNEDVMKLTEGSKRE